MLKSDIKRVKLLDDRKYYSVVGYKKSRYSIVMTSLTDAEDKALDNGHEITVERGELTFKLNPNIIYYYGNLDFTSGSYDMLELSDLAWLEKYEDYGFWLPGDYDYKTHTALARNGKPTYYDTICMDKILQYVHACLGKPKNVVIFKLAWK